MSSVVGIDLSTKALDLVALDENTNRAEWVRCELPGAKAWDRTLAIREQLPPREWWQTVYLVAIESPYGSGQPGTLAKLSQVVGAVAASLPARLRVPERCWLVRPDEWKGGLGLKAKPTETDLFRIAPGNTFYAAEFPEGWEDDQNRRDAFCLAMWARDTNAKGVAA